MHWLGLMAMAWRNLWRNTRRTAITLVGIAVGVCLAILFNGIGDASYAQMIDYAAKLGGGHLSMQHPEYNRLPSLKKTVKNADRWVAELQARPEVERVVPRIIGATMLATAANSFGAGFMAIDPTVETEETLMVLGSVVEGEVFVERTGEGVVLGTTLAENLEVGVGNKVVYTLTDTTGEIVSGLARVSGIVATGAPSVDSGLCLFPIGAVAELAGFDLNEVTHVATFLHDHGEVERLAADLDETAGKWQVPVAAVTWFEAAPGLAGLIAMKLSSTLVMETIIICLLAAGIFNQLFVSVMERLREFGILSAIGFSATQLFVLVVGESLWLALCGLLAAALLTAGPYYYLNVHGIDMSGVAGTGTEVAGVQMEPHLYAAITAEHMALVAVLAVLATVLAGIYPAWRAGRVAPAQAVRLV